MNPSFTSAACQCVACQGIDCRCGCQAAVAPSTAAAGPACGCGPQCGCDAAEQGCLCNPRRS